MMTPTTRSTTDSKRHTPHTRTDSSAVYLSWRKHTPQSHNDNNTHIMSAKTPRNHCAVLYTRHNTHCSHSSTLRRLVHMMTFMSIKTARLEAQVISYQLEHQYFFCHLQWRRQEVRRERRLYPSLVAALKGLYKCGQLS